MTYPIALKQAMPIVAAALGRKFGVTVRVGGTDACTDGRTIQVPALSDNAALLPVAWGYLAHEAGHVRHTDFSVYQQGAATADPLQRNLQNILEDVRIEQALAKPYPGTRETLQAVCARLLADGGFSAPSVDAHPARVLSSYLLLALRHQVLGYAALSAEAAKAEAVLRAVFPARTVRRLQGLMAEAHRLASTGAAVELARRMRALLEDEAQSPAADPNPPAGTPAEENRSGSNETQQLEPSKATKPADGPASDGKDIGPTDTNGQPESNTSEGAKMESTPGPDRASADDASATTANADTEETAQQAAVARALGAMEADLPGDLFVQARALLEDAAPASSRCVLPQPARYDGSAQAGLHLLAHVQPESRRLLARLQGLVQASRFDRPLPVRSGPRLMPKRLYRAAVGDPRLFARKRERIAVNTALHLLVDLSSSMNAPVRVNATDVRRRDTVALEAALALALALDAIHGVSLAVSAFPGRSGDASVISTLMTHGERARARAGAFVQSARGGTPMRGALCYAAADLLARPEPRRVILVLTDGQPAEPDATRALLTQCAEAGLETLGIGIGIDVSALFSTAIRVDDIRELKTTLFGAAERLLLAA